MLIGGLVFTNILILRRILYSLNKISKYKSIRTDDVYDNDLGNLVDYIRDHNSMQCKYFSKYSSKLGKR